MMYGQPQVTQMHYQAALQIAGALMASANVPPQVQQIVLNQLQNTNSAASQQLVSAMQQGLGMALAPGQSITQQDIARVINPLITAWVNEVMNAMRQQQGGMMGGGMGNMGMGGVNMMGGMMGGNAGMSAGNSIYATPGGDAIPTPQPQPQMAQTVQTVAQPIQEASTVIPVPTVRLEPTDTVHGLIDMNAPIEQKVYIADLNTDVRRVAMHMDIAHSLNHDLEAIRMISRMVPPDRRAGDWLMFVSYPKLTVLAQPADRLREIRDKILEAMKDVPQNFGRLSKAISSTFVKNDYDLCERLILQMVNNRAFRYLRKASNVDAKLNPITSLADLVELEQDHIVSGLPNYDANFSTTVRMIFEQVMNTYFRAESIVDVSTHPDAIADYIKADTAYYYEPRKPSLSKYDYGTWEESDKAGMFTALDRRYTILKSRRTFALTNGLPERMLDSNNPAMFGSPETGITGAIWSASMVYRDLVDVAKSTSAVYGVKNGVAPELFLKEYQTIIPMGSPTLYLKPEEGIPGIM